MSQATEEVVQAAGGVVWRRAGAGGVEVLLVHRPKYDDWSLPKGKLDPGETHEVAAVREVEEETGLRCRLGDELRTVEYTDHRGRPKVVRYWAMMPEGDLATDGSLIDRFTPTEEIDEVRWVTRHDARDLVSYAHDAEVVDSLSV
ncbi:MAG TPA: NUDIX hydrolase [Acidimicrobiales bacterium]|nr:NUDIX hydrolase [Acidimicrobiales bacterium]